MPLPIAYNIVSKFLLIPRLKKYDIYTYKSQSNSDDWYFLVARPECLLEIGQYLTPAYAIDDCFVFTFLPHSGIEAVFKYSAKHDYAHYIPSFIPLDAQGNGPGGLVPFMNCGSFFLEEAITLYVQQFSSNVENKCSHAWVDVGFNFTKEVCKHCNCDKTI